MSWEEFNGDMLLVRDNCRLYNAPGTQVRLDCDVVFKFYLDESEKLASSTPQVSLCSHWSAVHDLHVISIFHRILCLHRKGDFGA